MANKTLYAALPLPLPTARPGPYIRLLKMDLYDGALYTILKVFKLSDCDSYKALSYTWGDPEDRLVWNVNGHDMLVTRNLHLAMTQFSVQYAGQWLWIDAISINQSDEAKKEREHQVGIMRDIYSQAQEVLVWLGASSNPKSATSLCNACEEFAIQMPRCMLYMQEVYYSRTLVINGAIDMALKMRPFTGGETYALFELLQRPYWNRVWIIQEICVAKEVRVHIDQDSVLWNDFQWTLLMLERGMPHDYRGLEANLRALQELRRVYQEETSASNRRLLDLLPLFRWSQASDKLDKAISLVGLVPEMDRDLVAIKYKVRLSRCYTPLMFGLLKRTGNLSMLLHCKKPDFVHSNARLPSWVADWSYDSSHRPAPRWGLREGNSSHSQSAMSMIIYNRHRATGTLQRPTLQLRHGTILTLRGTRVARVVEMAPVMEMQHQSLRPVKLDGTLSPMSPLRWSDFVAQIWTYQILSVFTTKFSLATLLLFPANCYRKGAALDVLLASTGLAETASIRLDNEKDQLRLFFLNLMKGVTGYDYIHLRITDGLGPDVPQHLAKEFRAFQNSLWWKLPLMLINRTCCTAFLRPIYIFFLGLSYENHRGAFPMLGGFMTAIALLLSIFRVYPRIVIPITNITNPIGLYLSTSSLRNPAKAKLLDMIPASLLGNRVARTDNGLLGVVPHNTRVGDEVALLVGGRCPFVIRKHGRKWKLVGDSYVYGMMEGEMWDEVNCEAMDFV